MKHFYSAMLALTGLTALPITAAYAAGAQLGYPTTHQGYLVRDYSLVADMDNGDATDAVDSHILSNRAVAAYNGNVVEPLRPDQVRSVRATPEQLQMGYDRLIRVIHNPAKVAQYPEATADVQVAYDCWALHQQAETNASHNMYKCEANFNRLIEVLDTTPVVAAPSIARYDVLTTHDIYFAWDKSTLTPAAKETLDKIKTELNNENDPTKHIAVQGFADRSGPVDYNQRLSERRVQVVAEYLGVEPVNNAYVDMTAYGETNLPTPTADGVREASNRTTKIAIVQDKAQQ